MKRISFYIVGLSVFSVFLCEGAGIVAWKDQSFHEDSMAKMATYNRRKLSGNEGVFNVNGKDIYLSANLYWYIDIPNSLPQELSNSTQYGMLLKQKYEITVFLKRFPKSSAILDPWLKHLQEYQQQYDSGQYLVDGAWIAKNVYEQQQTELRENRKQRPLKKEQKRKESVKNTVEASSDCIEREQSPLLPYTDGSLTEISDGSFEGARTVTKRLEQKKKFMDSAGQRQAQQFLQSIKRLFTAQSAYKNALQQQSGAKVKAEQYERQAEDDMRPSPLTGEPNFYMANNARKKARQVILNAEHALSSGKRELLMALKQSDTLACSLYKTIPKDAESLALAVTAISESYYGEIDFRSSFEEAKAEEDRRQEEIAREQEERRQQEERDQQIDREKEEERLREERCLREKREEITRKKEERKEAEEKKENVKPPSSPSPQTAPVEQVPAAMPQEQYMNDQDANRMIWRTLGSHDSRALDGINEPYRKVIQESTDPVDILGAVRKAYESKGELDPAMYQYLVNMAMFRALSNKVGQGLAYHPSLSKAFPSLPSVIEMGDYSWEEEVNKMIGASQETYNSNFSLACRQRARDIIKARSLIMGGSMDLPEDIYKKLGISKDTDPSPLSGITISLISLILLILVPLGIFCRLRAK